jgi:large conductance mechanosensitive channel
MKRFLHEFREFILIGNAINLTVGIIIGAAFKDIVTSLTDNILKPVMGLFLGGSFDSLKITVMDNDIRYGVFIASIINFLLMSFIVFLLVKFVNRIITLNKKPSVPDKRSCPYCLTQIDISASKCPACTSVIDAPDPPRFSAGDACGAEPDDR